MEKGSSQSGGEDKVLESYIFGEITLEEMEKRIPKILEFADIGDFIHQPVKTYSRGMFARLAFAVAINVEPDIFSYLDLSGVTMNILGEEYDSIYDYSQLELRDKYALFLKGNNALTVIKKGSSFKLLPL